MLDISIAEIHRLQEGVGPESDEYWAQAARGQGEAYKKLLVTARKRIQMDARRRKLMAAKTEV